MVFTACVINDGLIFYSTRQPGIPPRGFRRINDVSKRFFHTYIHPCRNRVRRSYLPMTSAGRRNVLETRTTRTRPKFRGLTGRARGPLGYTKTPRRARTRYRRTAINRNGTPIFYCGFAHLFIYSFYINFPTVLPFCIIQRPRRLTGH